MQCMPILPDVVEEDITWTMYRSFQLEKEIIAADIEQQK